MGRACVNWTRRWQMRTQDAILCHDGTFTDLTSTAGVAGGGWSTSAAWVDYDNDGKLDLVVARYMKWDFPDLWCGEHREGYRSYCHPDLFQPETMLLYHNEDGRHFREMFRQAGLTMPGKGLGVANRRL